MEHEGGCPRLVRVCEGQLWRCCLACVLPCGALDVIRIVHLNGHVEEITRPISAKEVMDANPNHVLSKPSSQGVVRRIVILSPESDLKRGNIYFLIPSSSLPEKKITSKNKNNKKMKKSNNNNNNNNNNAAAISTSVMTSQSNASIIKVLSTEGKCSRRDRRSSTSTGRPWRPHLDSISEDLS
ncbi:hypothetical protein Sjap_014243 [Stephania japonica]|uniref:Uncharacterized protein n=1 Tax=Stephania japonica TaxID=461633 RepID=A0AAP0IZG9_9MAGN